MHNFIGQMFPFVRGCDNSQAFLLIWASSPTDEADGMLSVAAEAAQGLEDSESHSVQILELGDLYIARVSCAHHA